MTQLIYKTQTPHAVKLLADFRTDQIAANEAWAEFAKNLTAAYPRRDKKVRDLAVMINLVIGFKADAPGETAPPGWMFSAKWDCFTPDSSTSDGRRYQQRMDDLPGMPQRFEIGQIGMPGLAEIRFDNSQQVIVSPTLNLSEEGDTIYALWDVREAKPAIDMVLAKQSDTEWVEVPRSVWYARVEAYEAAHAGEDPGAQSGD